MYHLMGKLDEAENEYNEMLKIDPGNEILLDNIERLKKQKEKIKENGFSQVGTRFFYKELEAEKGFKNKVEELAPLKQ